MLTFDKLVTTFMTAEHVCVCLLYVCVCSCVLWVQCYVFGCVCMCIESQHCSHLAFCSCLSRMLSRRWGLGMKAMSPPSFTSLPIHQSLLYFWEGMRRGRSCVRGACPGRLWEAGTRKAEEGPRSVEWHHRTEQPGLSLKLLHFRVWNPGCHRRPLAGYSLYPPS